MPQPPEIETLSLPFTGGIDQKTEPEYLDPSSRVLDVSNGVWLKDGGIRKRFGVGSLSQTQLSGDPVMGPALRLIPRGQEIMRTDGEGLFEYSPTAAMWTQRGLVPPVYATRQRLYSSTVALAEYCVTEGSGFRACTYRDTLGTASAGVGAKIYLSLYDLATGAAVFLHTTMASGTGFINPISHIVGGFLYIFWRDFSTTNISCKIVNLTTMVQVGPTTVVSDANTTVFDVTPYVGATGLLIMYEALSGGFPNVKYLRLEALPLLTVTSSGFLTNNSADNGATFPLMACRHDLSTFNAAWFLWQQRSVATLTYGASALNATTWAALGVSPFPVTFTGYTTSLTVTSLGLEITTATQAQFTFQTFSIANTSIIYSTGGLSTRAKVYPLGRFLSRPFNATINGVTRCYVLFSLEQAIVSSGFIFSTYALIDMRSYEATGNPRIVATIAPRQGSVTAALSQVALDGRPPYLSSIGLPSAGKFSTMVPILPPEELGGLTTNLTQASPVSLDLVTFDFTGALTWQSAVGDAETYIACGTPSFYEGAGLQECSFFSWPTLTLAAPSGTGGSLGTGSYQFAIVYAQPDSTGLIHRSAAFTFTVATTGPTAKVQVTAPNLPYTNRNRIDPFAPATASRVPYLELYRSVVNGTTLFFDQVVPVDPVSNSSTLTLLSTAADSIIQSNALLYTTGGVLDSVCPPSFRAILRHNLRIWGIDDTGYALWFSTEFNGTDAPYFNEGLTIQFADGPLTALATLDDKLIVFASDRIWLLTGDGPPITGQGTDLSSPVALMTDVGATDWRSVVAFPGGVLFQAPSGGIYLLGRDLSVTSIGKTVQDITAGKTVVGAQLVAKQDAVRFLLSDGSSVSYDYSFGRWMRATYPYPLTSSGLSAGAWVAAASDGFVYQESAGWFDVKAGVSTWITVTVVTGWIKQQTLQGWLQFGPVQGIAAWLDPCDILVTLTYDYGRASQSHTFPHSLLFAANNVDAQWQFTPQAANSTGSAIQVTLSDAAAADGTSVTGQGVRWLGLALDLLPIGMRNLNLSASVKA